MNDWKPIFWPDPTPRSERSDGPHLELVFLLKNPLPMDAQFVADTALNAFGVLLLTTAFRFFAIMKCRNFSKQAASTSFSPSICLFNAPTLIIDGFLRVKS